MIKYFIKPGKFYDTEYQAEPTVAYKSIKIYCQAIPLHSYQASTYSQVYDYLKCNRLT